MCERLQICTSAGDSSLVVIFCYFLPAGSPNGSSLVCTLSFLFCFGSPFFMKLHPMIYLRLLVIYEWRACSTKPGFQYHQHFWVILRDNTFAWWMRARWVFFAIYHHHEKNVIMLHPGFLGYIVRCRRIFPGSIPEEYDRVICCYLHWGRASEKAL